MDFYAFLMTKVNYNKCVCVQLHIYAKAKDD